MPHPFLHAQPARGHGPGSAALTLIELLVVLAIIAVLAALLLPALGQARRQADSVQCVAQLGKIGTAIAAYAGDHDGLLPGPLTMPQGATYAAQTPGSLARLLENYLGTSGPAAADGARQSALFLCPAATRAAHGQPTPSYLANMIPVPGYGQSAWGDAALHQEPLRQVALTNLSDDLKDGRPLNLAEVWAIKDADQAYFKEINEPSSKAAEGLLPTPAHGDHRNALFHDFHVARVQVIVVLAPVTPPPKTGER